MPLETPLGATPEAVRDALAPLRGDFSVALYAAGNAFAVGAVIRVAHSFLAREVLVVGDGGWYAKASMGMHKYETVVRVPDVEALRLATQGRPLWAVRKRLREAVGDGGRGGVLAGGGVPLRERALRSQKTSSGLRTRWWASRSTG